MTISLTVSKSPFTTSVVMFHFYFHLTCSRHIFPKRRTLCSWVWSRIFSTPKALAPSHRNTILKLIYIYASDLQSILSIMSFIGMLEGLSLSARFMREIGRLEYLHRFFNKKESKRIKDEKHQSRTPPVCMYKVYQVFNTLWTCRAIRNYKRTSFLFEFL